MRDDLEVELVHGLERDAVEPPARLPLGLDEPKLALEILRKLRQTHKAIEKRTGFHTLAFGLPDARATM